ncbi:MAG: hypothetical protein NXI32_10760 [bacterium]|nr:hypothetical protein [bacterium]
MNRQAATFVLTLIAAVGCPACRPLLGSDLSKLLHAVFDESSHRQPTGSELNYYSNVFRNQGSLEGYIQLMGSNDYFVSQSQRNWENYVNSLYVTMLGRPPRGDELRFWVQQFQVAGSPQVEMVREFCRANRVTQLPSSMPQLPPYQLPNNNAAIANELVNEVNLFSSLISRDIGGSRFGGRLVELSRNLLSVSEQYREIVSSPRYTGNHVAMSADNLERAMQALEEEYHRVPGASYQSQQILYRISQLVSAAIGGRTNQPPAFSPPQSGATNQPGYTSGQLDSVLADVRNFAYGLQSYSHQSPFYANIFRDVQGLLSQLEALRLLERRGESGRRMQEAAQPVLQQAQHISQDMQQADFAIQRAWWDLQVRLQAAINAAGYSGGGFYQASHPVLLDQPSWGGAPYQTGGYYRANRNQQTVDLCDQLSYLVEGYIASLRTIESSNRRVRPMVDRLQDLNHETARLRQSAANGSYGNQLSESADRLMQLYDRAAREFERMVASDANLNSPQFMQLGELIQRLRYATRGQQA